jgi:5-methylcytosine-specific restriction endonuclease McrA
MSNINKRYTLILNRHFHPLGIEGVEATFGHFVVGEGKALDPETFQTYSFHDWIKKHNIQDKNVTIRTEKWWILIPEILVLNTGYQKTTFKKKPSLSKRKVFERDRNTCGYCEAALNSHNKTIDHVIPVSRGGAKHEYGNVVACCHECNSKKGNKTPEEMGWKVNHRLVSPETNILFHVPRSKWLDSWKHFLKEMQ